MPVRVAFSEEKKPTLTSKNSASDDYVTTKAPQPDSPSHAGGSGGQYTFDEEQQKPVRVADSHEQQTIVMQSRPLPQKTVYDSNYVEVETDRFAEAHNWASEQVARKWPGTTGILHSLDSLIKQKLAAKAPTN